MPEVFLINGTASEIAEEADGLAPPAARGLGRLRPLFDALLDLKRIRVSGAAGSLADGLFARAWGALVAGAAPKTVADRTVADALVAVRLGGMTAAVLANHGLTDGEAHAIRAHALDDVAGDALDAPTLGRLRAALGAEWPGGPAPAFVAALADQPRAGATHPGVPRMVLAPAESHGDHCLAVATFGYLAAPAFGAEPAEPFLTGLAHHLFNASLPDIGHAGDVFLGDDAADRLWRSATDRALATLAEPLAGRVEAAIGLTREAAFARGDPAARAFQAADALDRTLELAWHARSAAFALRDALGPPERGGLNVVHAGFPQRFQRAVLAAVGLGADLR